MSGKRGGISFFFFFYWKKWDEEWKREECIYFLPPGWPFPTSEKRDSCERGTHMWIIFIEISNARDITINIRVQYFFNNR